MILAGFSSCDGMASPATDKPAAPGVCRISTAGKRLLSSFSSPCSLSESSSSLSSSKIALKRSIGFSGGASTLGCSASARVRELPQSFALESQSRHIGCFLTVQACMRCHHPYKMTRLDQQSIAIQIFTSHDEKISFQIALQKGLRNTVKGQYLIAGILLAYRTKMRRQSLKGIGMCYLEVHLSSPSTKSRNLQQPLLQAAFSLQGIQVCPMFVALPPQALLEALAVAEAALSSAEVSK